MILGGILGVVLVAAIGLFTWLTITEYRPEAEEPVPLYYVVPENGDAGEGKLAQARQLREFLSQEYEKGNYVVAGGDWNQIFPNADQTWPNRHQELWAPGYLDESELEDGWSYVWDDTVPSCRLLNQPYDPSDAENTQYYVIDGFLISPNLTVEQVETLDLGFVNSDHNPVTVKLSWKN